MVVVRRQRVKEIFYVGVGWIYLFQDWDQWWALVRKAMNFRAV
jgi:hypothetical protein